jgi:hypothetical protein
LDGGHRYLVPDVDLLLNSDIALPEGLETFVWTAQRFRLLGAELGELASRGVAGIITDDPESTRALIRSLT